MGRQERKDLILQIEKIRGSRVVCYITGDRAPFPAQIGDDAVRPLYDHLRQVDKTKLIDFFIYSRGGAIDVPWRIVSALRTYSDAWSVLIPYRANSAATLIALGADEIIMGFQAELGPIDPIMNVQRWAPHSGGGTYVQEAVNVEDVMAYVRFVQDRARLTDQASLSTGLAKLTERLDAVILGNAYRTHLHIRDVARRTLLSKKKPPGEHSIATIVERLAEKVYAHGHAVGFSDAEEIGLPVKRADPALEPLMWRLLEDYEDELKLRKPIDPMAAVALTDRFVEEGAIAIIESSWGVDRFEGQLEIVAKRQIPPKLDLTLNVTIPLPPNVQPQTLPPALQQALQQAQQALIQQAQQALQQALRQKAPLLGVEVGFRGGAWKRHP